MKSLLSALLALSLITLLAGPAAAADGYAQKKAHAKKHWRKPASREPEAGALVGAFELKHVARLIFP